MRRASLAALTLAASAGILPAYAQDQRQATLTAKVSQSAVMDTNYNLDDPDPGNTYYGDTRFGLDYLNQTLDQSLALGFDTGLRALDEAKEDFEFVLASPSTAYVDYRQEGPNTAFDGGARLRTRRVDSGEIDDEGALPDDLTPFQDDVTEYRTDANMTLTFGPDAPSSYEFSLVGTNFDYSSDSDNDSNRLVPRRSIEGQASWTLEITPVLSTIVFGSYYYYTSDANTEDKLRVAEGEAGLVYEPSEALRIRGGLGYADRNRTELDLQTDKRETTQHDTGLTARGDIRYELPSWTLLGNARWTAAAPSGSRLSGAVRAIYDLPRGQVAGRVFQRYGGGQGGDEVRITGAGIGLDHDLNSVSRLNFDASYAVQVNEDNKDEPNIDRTDFTASYVYDVTRTVSAELGYGYRHRIEDPEDADSHRLFVVIGKTFETGL
jgi:hypothetical protein